MSCTIHISCLQQIVLSIINFEDNEVTKRGELIPIVVLILGVEIVQLLANITSNNARNIQVYKWLLSIIVLKITLLVYINVCCVMCRNEI